MRVKFTPAAAGFVSGFVDSETREFLATIGRIFSARASAVSKKHRSMIIKEVSLHGGRAPTVLYASAPGRSITIVGVGPKADVDALRGRLARMRARAWLETLPVCELELEGLSPLEFKDTLRTWWDLQSGLRLNAWLLGENTRGRRLARPMDHESTHLVSTLIEQAEARQTGKAREQFKDVLERAGARPQLITREAGDVLMISVNLLKRFVDPLSAPALVNAFRALKPISPFEISPSVPPAAALELPKLRG